MWPIFVAMWGALAVCMVLTMYSDILRALLIHGKVRQDTQMRHRGVIGALLRVEMPKSGWIYFYFAGAVYNLGIAIALIAVPHHALTQHFLRALQSWTPADQPHAPAFVEIRSDAIAVIALLGLQDTRRFLESVFITEFGDAKMHVALLVAGLIHYLGIAPSVLSTPQSRADVANDHSTSLLQFAGLVLFVYGSFEQYGHNKLLAQQKRASGGKHVLPRGRWFDHVLCPLYSTELLIYVGLALVCGLLNPMVNLVLAWVVLNQSICAFYGKQWYLDKFRSDGKLPKWVLVPGVW